MRLLPVSYDALGAEPSAFATGRQQQVHLWPCRKSSTDFCLGSVCEYLRFFPAFPSQRSRPFLTAALASVARTDDAAYTIAAAERHHIPRRDGYPLAADQPLQFLL